MADVVTRLREEGERLMRYQVLLTHSGLRNCQITAIENLEKSFKQDRPRAVVQVATGYTGQSRRVASFLLSWWMR